MPLSEHVYCVAGTFKMTEQVEQWICITFCIKLEHSSMETIQIQKAAAYGQLVIGRFIMTMHLLVHCVSCSFLAKHQITQLTQPPYSPDLVPWDFWLFSKLKSPLKRKIFQTINEIQENTTGQLMVIPTKDCAECFEQSKRCLGSCVRSQGAYCEGDWGVIVQYTIFLVSCIFNKCFYFSYYMAGHFLERLYM